MAAVRRKVRGVWERVKDSGVWWIRYHDEQGREHREQIGSHKLAVEIYHKRKAQVAERRLLPERSRRCLRLRDAITEHVHNQRSASSAGDMRRFGRRWTKVLGDRYLDQIRSGDIERAIADRRDTGVGQQTIYHEVSFLRRVYSVAVRDGNATTNPARGLVKAPRAHRVRYLTEDEQAALFAELPGRFHPLVTVALNTGLRQGEQFRLRWDQVDFNTATVQLPKTKTGEPRAVPLNSSALEAFRAQPRQLHCRWVFAGERSQRPLNARNFTRRFWVPALHRAGVSGFTWHDLRHTYASRLVMGGVDIRTVAELLGHTRLEMTMRYAHLSSDHKRAAVEVLNGISTGTTTGTGKSDRRSKGRK